MEKQSPSSRKKGGMRKYRFVDTTTRWGKFRKYSNVIYFFIAWNVFGVGVWKFLMHKSSSRIPGFDEMSESEKNARIMGVTPEKSIRIKGLKVEEIKPVLPKRTINDNDEENI